MTMIYGLDWGTVYALMQQQRNEGNKHQITLARVSTLTIPHDITCSCFLHDKINPK